jgi:putative hydroxymethylpyrimidine transport system permease protein
MTRNIFIFIVLLLVWQTIVSTFQLPDYILPSPLQVMNTIKHQWPLLLTQSVPTVIETLLGLVGGILFGAVTALLMAYIHAIRAWLKPLLLISQALPTFAIAPLLVILLGYGMSAKVVTVILMLYFPIASNFFDGLIQTKAEFLDLAKLMQARPIYTLLYIRLPAALPQFASGIRIATAGAPIGAVIGEWVGASKGLGFLMLNANARMQIDVMFAALFMLVLWNFILFFGVNTILKKYF